MKSSHHVPDPADSGTSRPGRRPTAAIGLGCVTFGREIERDASFALMDHAVARGVTFFDTAAAYGGGASESIVGEWLAAHRSQRDRLTVATKLLPPYSPERIAASLRESLARLKLEWVDLLFLHQWHDSAVDPPTVAALDALVKSGRVGAIGLSNFNHAQTDRMLRVQSAFGCAPARALQNIHNFAVRGFAAPLRTRCAEARVALVGYSPLGAGFLTGKHRAGVAPGSRFALMPGHQTVYFTAEAQARLAHLAEAAARAEIPLAHLALAWALRDPQIGTVLVGGRDRSHLDQAFVARSLVDHAVLINLANDLTSAADRAHGT